MLNRLLSLPFLAAALLATLLLAACGPSLVHLGQPPIADSPARQRHPSGRILVVVSSHGQLGTTGEPTGTWLSEVSHFVHEVGRHGFAVDFVSPAGAPMALDPASVDLDDTVNAAFLADAGLKTRFERPLAPAAVDPGSYAAVFYAGGHGTMWDFPGATDVARLAVQVHERGGAVAAVCHGPSALLGLRGQDGRLLLAGRQVTGFSNTEERLAGKTAAVPFALQDELTKAGGAYSKAFLPFSAHVVVDGRLVTGQNPASSGPVARALVEVLGRAP